MIHHPSYRFPLRVWGSDVRRVKAVGEVGGQGLLALLGLLAVVAVRLLQLRMLSRQAPNPPASATVPQEVVAVVAGSLHVSSETLTVGQFWRGVARLGGFIGRASDGDPGWQTLWAGWHRLQDHVWGFHFAQAPQLWVTTRIEGRGGSPLLPVEDNAVIHLPTGDRPLRPACRVDVNQQAEVGNPP